MPHNDFTDFTFLFLCRLKLAEATCSPMFALDSLTIIILDSDLLERQRSATRKIVHVDMNASYAFVEQR